jgi:enterochelin esterase-like enzyme
MIGGMGHGGLAAFYTAMKYPSKFGAAMCLSPSFWVGLDFVDGNLRKSTSRFEHSTIQTHATATLD